MLGYFFVFVMQTRLAKTPYVTKDVLAFLILLLPLPQCWGGRHLQANMALMWALGVQTQAFKLEKTQS